LIIGQGSYLQFAADQHSNAFELVLGNRRGFAFKRDDVHDAGALQNRQGVVGVKPREAIAGKQRPVDLLLAIFPPAPARNRRQERLEVLAFELLAHDVFVTRAGPNRKPLSVGSRRAVLAAAALS
jgi:hypothetical protein